MHDHHNDNSPLYRDTSVTPIELLADNLRMSFDIEVDTDAELDALIELLNHIGTVVDVRKTG